MNTYRPSHTGIAGLVYVNDAGQYAVKRIIRGETVWLSVPAPWTPPKGVVLVRPQH